MGGTILGPGTIFLMLVGAFVAVFHIDNWTSFYYNIVPILSFMFICFTCKSNVQVLHSIFLSFFLLAKELYLINSIWFTVTSGPDSINHLCAHNDGSDSWYGATVTRGRYRLSIGHILDIDVEFLLYRCVTTSSGIRLYNFLQHLFALNSIDVLVAHFVLDHKSEHCHMGYSWGASQENEKGEHSERKFSFFTFSM